jgi:two-component system LytT family response regulator
MISAIIIDDEQHCIKRLSDMLKNKFANDILLSGAFNNFDDGITAIKQLQPQLVFLDVQLDNDKTGFDLLKQTDKINFEVIFTTAYEQYAVRAFRISAIDYLLKPVDKDDMQQAINKLKEKHASHQLPEKLDVLFYNLKNIQTTSKRICVPVLNGMEVFQIADIMRCESNINYTTIFMNNKQKLTVAKTLKEFEELLSPYNFFRVHNSHLINMSYIKSYTKSKGGFVTLIDNSVIEVSKARKDEFLKRLMDV